MADLLVLEFEDLKREDYDRVNELLGVDPIGGDGDWPPGLLHHIAGPTDDGWMVVEVWASQADQAAFLESRLGRALQEGGAGEPSRLTWVPVVGHQQPAG